MPQELFVLRRGGFAGRRRRVAPAARDARAFAVGGEPVRDDASEDAIVAELSTDLRRLGFVVELGVGVSRFRVDVAVRKPEDRVYRLGILVDTAEQYATTDPFERDFIRPRLLKSFGWNVASVLARDWYDHRERELQRILELLQRVAIDSESYSVPNVDAIQPTASPEIEEEAADEEAVLLPPDPETESTDPTPDDSGDIRGKSTRSDP